MESIGGLPTHPLFVHAPVVLMPLAMLLALVLAARPTWRRTAGFALPVVAIVVLVATQLAITSGEALDELAAGAVDADRHESLALMTRNLIAAFAVSSTGLAILDRRQARDESGGGGSVALLFVALTVVTSIAATVWMVLTGHEGATMVWKGIIALSPAASWVR